MQNENDIEHVKFSIERLIRNGDQTQMDLLFTILSNIKNNPDIPKYKTVNGKKLSDHTKNVLSSIGFKRHVRDFQEYYSLNNTVENQINLDLFLDVIKRQKEYLDKQKAHHLGAMQQIKKDKLEKEKIHDQLIKERTSRRKYNGWLT